MKDRHQQSWLHDKEHFFTRQSKQVIFIPGRCLRLAATGDVKNHAWQGTANQPKYR